jgi:hypothetical protein
MQAGDLGRGAALAMTPEQPPIHSHIVVGPIGSWHLKSLRLAARSSQHWSLGSAVHGGGSTLAKSPRQLLQRYRQVVSTGVTWPSSFSSHRGCQDMHRHTGVVHLGRSSVVQARSRATSYPMDTLHADSSPWEVKLVLGLGLVIVGARLER